MKTTKNVVYVVHGGLIWKGRDEIWRPDPNTGLRAKAGGILLAEGEDVIFSGGPCACVRYSTEETTSMWDAHKRLLHPPDFSADAIARSHKFPSEAEVMLRSVMPIGDAGRVFLETMSRTTGQNVQGIQNLLSLSTFEGVQHVGAVTTALHMKRLLEEYARAGLNAFPVFAEDVLAQRDPDGIEMVFEYYSRVMGKTGPIKPDEVKNLIGRGRSIGQMVPLFQAVAW